MERIIKYITKIVIALFCLSLFASVIQHVALGGMRYGLFTESIRLFSSFPGYFKEALREVNSAPKTFLKTPENLESIISLDQDVIALYSFTNEQNGRSIKLVNLRDDEEVFKWNLNGDFKEHHRILNPILLPNHSICYAIANHSGLKKIDSIGNILWEQDELIFHHSLNLDHNGNLWGCAMKQGQNGEPIDDGVFINGSGQQSYLDEIIVQIDINDGSILYQKSLTEILRENNLLYLLIKTHHVNDPIHLNDVEPVLVSSNNFREGDVFISMRSMSLVLHFRPLTNKVIEKIEGPFSCQHDVDILNDSTIVLFNNNIVEGIQTADKRSVTDSPYIIDLANSNIVTYNLKSQNFNTLFDSVFYKYNITTGTEGLLQYIGKNLCFIEEQNSGLIWIFDGTRVVYKNVLHSHIEGYHHLPNWVRIINTK